MTEVAGIVSKLQAGLFDLREEFRLAYRQLPNEQAYWALVDLAGSGQYRSTHGHEMGYIQGETFLRLAQSTVDPYQTASLLKEMGDAVLLRATDFRDLLEPILLMDLVAQALTARSKDPRHVLAIRAGITFGPAKKLQRRGVDDYLGEAIDRAARLVSHKNPVSNIILDESTVRQEEKATIGEYPSLSIGSRIVISAAEAKSKDPLHCFPLLVARDLLLDFRDFFSVWR